MGGYHRYHCWDYYFKHPGSAEFTVGRLLPCRLPGSESIRMGYVGEPVRHLESHTSVHNMVYVHTKPRFPFSIRLKEDILTLS